MTRPADVIRTLGWEELPPSVREIPSNYNPLDEGVLMKHQRDWVRLCQDNALCIAEKGRRTGITYATALNDTITAASNRDAGGDNIYYIGDTKEKGLEFIGYSAHMAKVMTSAMADGWQGIEVFLFEDQQPDGSTKNITSYRIRFASGFHITALSSRPASIRGLQGIVNIDEAAFHTNVQAVIDATLALIIWGGKIRIISTHNGEKNAFNQLVRDTRAGMYAFKILHVTFDDAVANGLYERVCLIKGWTPTPEGKKEWYERVRGAYGANKAAMREELDAIPREGSGVAIPGILIDKVMTEDRPVIRLVLDSEFAAKGEEYRKSWCEAWIEKNIKPLFDLLNPKSKHFFGQDFARHWDFSIIAPGEEASSLLLRVPWIVELNNVPTRQQEQILWYIIDHLPNFRGGAMDATGTGETLAEYTADKYGAYSADTHGGGRIAQIKLNDAWFRENMVKFQNRFEDQKFDLPRDNNTRNDLRTLELINGIIKLPSVKVQDLKDAKIKRHGDAAIALAMLDYAARNILSGPIEYECVSKRRFTQKGAY